MNKNAEEVFKSSCNRMYVLGMQHAVEAIQLLDKDAVAFLKEIIEEYIKKEQEDVS